MQNNFIIKGTPCDNNHKTTIKKRLAFIEENQSFHKNQKVLDIGVGYGVYLRNICENVGQYVGIDPEEINLKKVKKQIIFENVEVIQNVAEFLPFEENSFDNIVMIEVLEHVNTDKKAIQEIFRVLKPGGSLVITAPNKLFPFETHGFRIGSHNYSTRGFGFPFLPYFPDFLRKHFANANVYSPQKIKKMLENEGFTIQKIAYLGPGLDQLAVNFPKYSSVFSWIQRKFDSLESVSPVNIFLTTIIIHARKEIHCEFH